MKSLSPIAAAAAALMLLAQPAAASDNIDFGSATCREFVEVVQTSSQEDVAGMFLWLDGYLSGVSGDTVLDWRVFESFVANLSAYCVDHGKENLLKAARTVGVD